MDNTAVGSTLCFYNQSAGSIIFNEKIGNVQSKEMNAYITGSGKKFSTWQDGIESGEVDGLPEGCTVYTSTIMSGQQDENGNFEAEGLNTFTYAEGCGDDEAIQGIWWLWRAIMTLQGECLD